jgi:hypothetical protein
MMRHWLALQALIVCALFASLARAQNTAAPKSLPYAAVHNPQFISASDATFMNGDDRGEAKDRPPPGGALPPATHCC